MKIAIEAQRIFRKEKHGMDYVALETIRELQKIDQQNEYFILVSPGDDVCLQESANMHIVTVNWPSYPLWEQIGLPLALKKIKPDLLHCTSNTAPVYGNIPLVLTLHDIIFLEKKQGKNQSMYQRLGRFYRKIIVPQILTKCKRIITVSHFECNRISHFLHIDKQLLVAVYNGYSQHFIPIWNAQAITARYIKNHPYLFFLGNTDPKKNTARVLQAYRIYLKKSSQPLPLLIADLKEEIIDEYLNREGLQEIKKMLYHPGYIPNTELPAVYSGASVFIYTSLRESFGIPILEAMACGTPVITSTTSAMPEIAGPEGILVNPFEPEEIASALLHLEENAEFYQSQTAYGLERVRRFSWENTAREILNIYKEKDFTSHDVVAKLRGILRQKKIGHTGTLDPNAEGVLPVCLGKGTKLCDMLTGTKKQYKVSFVFEKETDTEDIWGTVTKTHEPLKQDAPIKDTILSFVGEYDQVPPMYSAKKINGKKLYELAREGKIIERKPERIRIYDISDIEISYPEVTMTVTCSKGTYIRSLCRDIGHKLQNGACMTKLVRTRSSGFQLEYAHTLSEIEEAVKTGKIEEWIIPIEKVFLKYQKGTVKKDYDKVLFNGNPLKKEMFYEINLDTTKKLRVYDESEQFIGIYYWKKNMFFPDKIFYDNNQ